MVMNYHHHEAMDADPTAGPKYLDLDGHWNKRTHTFPHEWNFTNTTKMMFERNKLDFRYSEKLDFLFVSNGRTVLCSFERNQHKGVSFKIATF